MNVQPARRTIQILSIIAVIFIPVLQSYSLLLIYLPTNYIGALWDNKSILSSLPDFLKAGYLSWVLVFLDWLLGWFNNQAPVLKHLLSYFTGSFWSVTLAGVTIIDPLALFQTFTSHQPLTLGLIASGLIPIVLSLFFGRFFCSWVCPVNSLLELVHALIKKTGHKALNLKILTNPNLRYLLLAIGLILPFFGYTLFPYILPYAILGRWFYYLSIGVLFLPGLTFLLTLLLFDLIQKGFWCSYLCPTGALLSLTGRKRLVKIKHEEASCRERCSLCKQVCRWNANPKTRQITNCTNCGLCVQKCPGKALQFSVLAKK